MVSDGGATDARPGRRDGSMGKWGNHGWILRLSLANGMILALCLKHWTMASSSLKLIVWDIVWDSLRISYSAFSTSCPVPETR